MQPRHLGASAVRDQCRQHVAKRRSVKNRTTSADPDIRWRIAEAALIMNAVGPQIRELAHDIDSSYNPL